MRKSSKREYEKAFPYGISEYGDTASVKKQTHRAVRRKLNDQTKNSEQIAGTVLHCSDTDMNYQKGL